MDWFRIEEEDEKKEEKPEEKILERLLRSRTILISSAIDEMTVDKVIKNLVLMEEDDPDKPISVYINSPGGGADSGFAIYDMLRFVRPKVRTICTGICASSGVIIFLGGDKGMRLSLPNSRFLIHEPRVLSAAYGLAADLAITAKELLKIKDRFNAIVAEATGKEAEAIAKDVKRDFWLSAEEAMKYGLVDRIVTTREEIGSLERV